MSYKGTNASAGCTGKAKIAKVTEKCLLPLNKKHPNSFE